MNTTPVWWMLREMEKQDEIPRPKPFVARLNSTAGMRARCWWWRALREMGRCFFDKVDRLLVGGMMIYNAFTLWQMRIVL